MSKVRVIVLIGAAAIALGGWYLFRPERAFLDARVSEPAPVNASSVLLEGQFSSRAHEGRGVAQLITFADGRRVLRFTGFETSNGPDVRVYLLGATEARTNRDLELAGFLDLGPLKGNVGDQNYVIPAGADVARYRAVSIWCRRFAVNFAIAVLEPPRRGA